MARAQVAHRHPDHAPVRVAQEALDLVAQVDARPAREVADKAQELVAAMADCGCMLNNAYMQHSLLALVVIPELRISDKGIIDVRQFKVIPLIG